MSNSIFISSTSIIKEIPRFKSEAELISWTREVFNFRTSPGRFFKSHTWNKNNFIRMGSVRLTPRISFLGKDYYLSNI